MNLIEQFGGYEKVKSIRDINIKEFDGDASGVTIHYMGNSITQEDLEKSLLEHRRQHNIFEIGDKVVLLKNQHMWHKMESIYTVTSTDIYDGITIGVAIEYKNTSHGNEIGNIRHATDEEIKAGRRL